MIHQASDFVYGGIYDRFFWDKTINPNATVQNGLANCTTMAYGLSLIDAVGDVNGARPVSRIPSAGQWHRYLINGWTFIPFEKSKVKVGDIIEWEDHNHVAKVISVVDGYITVGASFYTGEHGKSVYNGHYDTRPWDSLQELSDFMYNNYPFRFYHECTYDSESGYVGGSANYILVKPQTIFPVERDSSVDQIQVLTDTQNIRNNANQIVGVAQHGYYNVIGQKSSNGYIWYEVEPDRYIAGVKNRVIFIKANSDYIAELEAEIAKLKIENQHYLDQLNAIRDILE